jgi:hypothetical protein
VNLFTAAGAMTAVRRGHVACKAGPGAPGADVAITSRERTMSWAGGRSVVLVSNDSYLLDLVAAELREMGCRVFCARDFGAAADLVRMGMTRRFVLVRLGDDVFSPEVLREAMAEHLPGYAIRAEEAEGDWTTFGIRALRQLPN